jgi:hypothetical protein
MLIHWTHHRRSLTDANAVDHTQKPEDAPATSTPPKMSPLSPHLTVVNSQQLQAECHPHLGPNTDSVPNLDVSRAYNPSGLRMKVRFWVDGDGFTTSPFIVSVGAVSPDDQTAALDFVRHLIFSVPNTPQCHERKMEMIGTFIESMDAGGQWTTLFDVHPRYYIENGVVVNRPQ